MVIPGNKGSYDHICPNCGGWGFMTILKIKSGPHPMGRAHTVWLNFDPTPDIPGRPTVSGWYEIEMEQAPCPVCTKGSRLEYYASNSGLMDADRSISLSSFRVDTPNTAPKRRALDAARSLLASNCNPDGFVTFWGSYGTGKSHLLKGIVNGFCAISVMARYYTLADLLADIRDNFGAADGVRAAEAAIDNLRDAKVLCIDEVDKVNLTGWAKETIFRILDSRYNERQSMLTVLALNTSPDEYEMGYLSSRMSGGLRIEVGGADMRQIDGLKAEKAMTHAAAVASAEDARETPQIPVNPAVSAAMNKLTHDLDTQSQEMPF
jgi:DNA replication protein DnaC